METFIVMTAITLKFNRNTVGCSHCKTNKLIRGEDMPPHLEFISNESVLGALRHME